MVLFQLKKFNVFIKLGGSCITNKQVGGSLIAERVRTAAFQIARAIDAAAGRGEELSLILAHGAGSYGHIPATEYNAVHGVDPVRGWEGFYRIRESMARMNIEFVRYCEEAGLHPVTVQPSAVATAGDGRILSFDTTALELYLRHGQVPLIHGDIVPDEKRGFTIASTEALLETLAGTIRFDRIILAGDTDGVLDKSGGTIPEIRQGGLAEIDGALGGAEGPDVTGGMRAKVERLAGMAAASADSEIRLLSFLDRPEKLFEAILGDGGGGTLVRGD